MRNIYEVKQELDKLQSQLQKLKEHEYEFDFDEDDPNECLMSVKVNHCLEQINDLYKDIKRLNEYAN